MSLVGAALRNDADTLWRALQLGTPPDEECSGQVALHVAARNGAVECLKVLLAAGVDPNWARPSDGVTAFHAAAWGYGSERAVDSRVECIRLLVAAGANLQVGVGR